MSFVHYLCIKSSFFKNSIVFSMKNLYILAAFAMFSLTASAQTREVVFRIDLNGLTPAAEGVSVAGNFQDLAGGTEWTPGIILLTDADANLVYEALVVFNDTMEQTIEYKYLNGIAWGTDETTVPVACNAGGEFSNRLSTIPAGSSLYYMPLYLFNTCDESAFANNNELTTASSLKLAPNPTTGNSVLSFDNASGANHTVTVASVTGQVVRTYSNVVNNVTIEGGDLTTGVYYVTVSNARGERATTKLVIR
jgi:hypothetical protein